MSTIDTRREQGRVPCVTRRDPLRHTAPIVEQGPGEFVAEVGQLSGQPALVDVHAIGDAVALLIPPENLRALMIEEPDLGERIMRALILRRIVLIESGAGGPVLIGPETSPDVVRLQASWRATRIRTNCSTRRAMKTQPSLSSNMLRTHRTCRRRYVRRVPSS
jgi:hypothetical protein